jgi:hypothetical protein
MFTEIWGNSNKRQKFIRDEPLILFLQIRQIPPNSFIKLFVNKMV